MLQTLTVFVIFLGPLIFFHELGHFLFARLCGVRVETFSIGFGPKILKFKRGDTNYAISLIPLGGYVKMFGDDPNGKDEIPEDQKQFSFSHKTKLQKFWIVFGGPLANFLLAFFIYYFLLVLGETVPQVKFGQVKANSSLYSSGFRTGDELVKIDDIEISSLEDLSLLDEKISKVVVTRANQEQTLNVDLFSKTFIESFVELDQFLRKPIVVNVKNEKFLLTLTTDVNQQNSLEELSNLIKDKVVIHKLDENLKPIATEKFVELKISGDNFFGQLKKQGFYPLDMMVDGLIIDDPADKAKIKKNDILLSLNGEEIFNFNELRAKIQNLAKDKIKLNLTYNREGKVQQTVLEPVEKDFNGQKIFAIGIYSAAQMFERKMVKSKPHGLFESFGIAAVKTYQGSVAVLDGFKKLFSGAASMKNLGGPIAIAKQASYSLDISISYFFKMMALISLNLGILNLLPIPILDGGHILFLGLEFIFRGPVPKKLMMVAQQFGLSLLLLLMIFALGNDIVRLFN